MASRGLGTLTLDLIARIGGFERGMDKAARTADKRMREIERSAKRMGAFLGTAMLAGLSGAAVAISKTIDGIDELRDSSIRLGIGVETLSAFRYAAQQTGTDIEALGRGFKILAKNMADALNPKSSQAQVFDALGIKVTDATGKLKQFEQIIPEIADKFRQLEDGTTKAALAQELFGKSGLELVEFLNQGGAGIQQLTDRARELGLVIDQDTANAADQFNDTLADLKATMAGLTAQVAAELLPRLIELAQWAVDFVKDGSNARKIAEEIASAFDILTSAAGIVWKTLQTLGAATRGVTSDMTAFLLTMQAVGKARTFQFGDAQELMEQARLARQMASEQSAAIEKIWTAAEGRRGPSFANVRGGVQSTEDGQLNRGALNNALGGIRPTRGGGGSRKSSGKSDAQREAEQLQAAYDRMNDSLSEQIALFGQDGEAAKLRYELENGELAKLSPLQKDALMQQAQKLDLMRAEKAEQETLDKLTQDREDAVNRGIEQAADVIEDMEFELRLLGLSNDEREREIALRYAGAGATEAQRKAIIDLSNEMVVARREAEFWEEVQGQLSDAFVDLASGAKSLKDVVTDFFDALAQYIMRAIAEQWAQKIADLFKSNTTGAAASGSGGGWAWVGSALGALFGGGRASGGPVQSGMVYRVNENGPELLSVGGRDYLMMGSQAGKVTPNDKLRSGGGVTQVNNFSFAAPTDPRTQMQMASRVAFETRRAQSRN